MHSLQRIAVLLMFGALTSGCKEKEPDHFTEIWYLSQLDHGEIKLAVYVFRKSHTLPDHRDDMLVSINDIQRCLSDQKIAAASELVRRRISDEQLKCLMKADQEDADRRVAAAHATPEPRYPQRPLSANDSAESVPRPLLSELEQELIHELTSSRNYELVVQHQISVLANHIDALKREVAALKASTRK